MPPRVLDNDGLAASASLNIPCQRIAVAKMAASNLYGNAAYETALGELAATGEGPGNIHLFNEEYGKSLIRYKILSDSGANNTAQSNAPPVTYGMAVYKLAVFDGVDDVVGATFKSAVTTRDQRVDPEAVPLFAQKASRAVKDIIDNHLKSAGVDSVHQVQNCVLFLMRSNGTIDVGDRRLIAKIVNLTNQSLCTHPNHAALAFHKAACLIWRTAGAGDVRENVCFNEGDVEIRLAKVANRLRNL
ncbi:hypothetical protein BJ741DRAFT_575134 [Chytriomyces cf. hyalinus JEL632]|nr:hypothetical protein BJ741DRAFT_575134 [Chytriomyces cf. hyalinus JEL632]